MELGNIAFNIPPAMRLEKAETIELVLSLKQTADDLKKKLREEGVVGEIKDAQIKIDKNMQAILTGDGFQITPITTDTLPVSKQEPTTWKWDVRPLRSGTLELHVVINAMVDLNDGSGMRPYPIRTFDHKYDVRVPWGEGGTARFFKSNWQWLWVVLIAPALAWLWNRKRKKRGRAGFV